MSNIHASVLSFVSLPHKSQQMADHKQVWFCLRFQPVKRSTHLCLSVPIPLSQPCIGKIAAPSWIWVHLRFISIKRVYVSRFPCMYFYICPYHLLFLSLSPTLQPNQQQQESGSAPSFCLERVFLVTLCGWLLPTFFFFFLLHLYKQYYSEVIGDIFHCGSALYK